MMHYKCVLIMKRKVDTYRLFILFNRLISNHTEIMLADSLFGWLVGWLFVSYQP